ncbi:RNA 2',3'-cyclic phosphodiesterase [Candidatus Acetothermia bacterium]|nr:RNA 2',3'-cyclic phosphodiesterase [Candidatus Acetothermia bacterium]MCI2427784.1 RNA 2',3'-cyclic phosphodiesterase [Candidatus Acetothermia bacterium]
MRLFFSLPIDAETRKILAALSRRMQRTITARASWVKEENLHITTKFLGEVGTATIAELVVISQRVTEQVAPFILTIDRIDAFPSLTAPRVIWAGGERELQFIELVDYLENELERLDFPAEQRRPIPHITMARIKGRREQDIEEKIRALSLPDALQIEVNRLTLNESRLTPTGPIYTPVLELPLTG